MSDHYHESNYNGFPPEPSEYDMTGADNPNDSTARAQSKTTMKIRAGKRCQCGDCKAGLQPKQRNFTNDGFVYRWYVQTPDRRVTTWAADAEAAAQKIQARGLTVQHVIAAPHA